jgi:SAM-dependent methyltransferase
MPSHWPKKLPVLTPEQISIREDFVRVWLDELPRRYGVIERFNHRYVLLKNRPRPCPTLEIGAEIGAHLAYEDLLSQDYTALELREELARKISDKYEGIHIIIGDVQEHINAPDNSFDRIIAIHVLEHLPKLPAELEEIKRVIKPDGYISIVIPCEGGMAYTFARNFSARRLFEKRYHFSYDRIIQSEHVNSASEPIEECEKHFSITDKAFWPLKIPSINLNLAIGMTCRP